MYVHAKENVQSKISSVYASSSPFIILFSGLVIVAAERHVIIRILIIRWHLHISILTTICEHLIVGGRTSTTEQADNGMATACSTNT